MIVNPHLNHQYALQRQQLLRDEAAAHRLAGQVPAGNRFARFLRRGDRVEAAPAASGPVGKPLAQRS